jgi:hypothetical protein
VPEGSSRTVNLKWAIMSPGLYQNLERGGERVEAGPVISIVRLPPTGTGPDDLRDTDEGDHA